MDPRLRLEQLRRPEDLEEVLELTCGHPELAQAGLTRLADLLVLGEGTVATALQFGAAALVRDALEGSDGSVQQAALRAVAALAGPDLVQAGVLESILRAQDGEAKGRALEALCAVPEGAMALITTGDCYGGLVPHACGAVALLIAAGAPLPPAEVTNALAERRGDGGALRSLAAIAGLSAEGARAVAAAGAVPSAEEALVLPLLLACASAGDEAAVRACCSQRALDRAVEVGELGWVEAVVRAYPDEAAPRLSVASLSPRSAAGLRLLTVARHFEAATVEAANETLLQEYAVAEVQQAGLAYLLALDDHSLLNARACSAGARALETDLDVKYASLVLLTRVAKASSAARSAVVEAGGFRIACSAAGRDDSVTVAAGLGLCTLLCELGEGGRAACAKAGGAELARVGLTGPHRGDAKTALAAVRLLQRLCAESADVSACFQALSQARVLPAVADAIAAHLDDAAIVLKALYVVAELTAHAGGDEDQALHADAVRTACQALRAHVQSRRVVQQALRVLSNATLENDEACEVVAVEGSPTVCDALAAHRDCSVAWQYGFTVLAQVVDGASRPPPAATAALAVDLVYEVLDRSSTLDVGLLQLAMGLLASLLARCGAVCSDKVLADPERPRTVCHYAGAENSPAALVEHALNVLGALLAATPRDTARERVATADAAITLCWVVRTYGEAVEALADAALDLLCEMTAHPDRARAAVVKSDGLAILAAATLGERVQRADRAVRALVAVASTADPGTLGVLRGCGAVEALLGQLGERGEDWALGEEVAAALQALSGFGHT